MPRLRSSWPPHQELIVAAQRVTQRHVQRPDVVTAGTELKWTWNPETRGLGYAHYMRPRVAADRWSSSASRSRISSRRSTTSESRPRRPPSS